MALPDIGQLCRLSRMQVYCGISGFFLGRLRRVAEAARAALLASSAEAADAVDCWQPMMALLVPWLRTESLRSAQTTRSLVVDGSRYIWASPAVLSTVKPLTLLFATASKVLLHRPIPSYPSVPVTLLFHTAVPLV